MNHLNSNAPPQRTQAEVTAWLETFAHAHVAWDKSFHVNCADCERNALARAVLVLLEGVRCKYPSEAGPCRLCDARAEAFRILSEAVPKREGERGG